MALQTVPLLREDSILCWEQEATFKTAPAAATWASLGRVTEWACLGPEMSVQRDAIAGSGREAATISVAGVSYPPKVIGPFQVVDPRFLGYAWGQEVSAPAALGGGYFRHTVTKTANGRLPSMSMQQGDYKNGVLTDGLTYLGVLMPRLSLRGEEKQEGSESTGRVMAAPTFLAHDDSSAVAGKAVTLSGSEPYRFSHASIQFYNSDVDWRIRSWEFTLDNNAKSNYYHQSTNGDKPFESPPEGILYDLRMEIVADGHLNTTSGKLIRDLLRDKVKGNGQIKYVRTANQDEWAINLTDIQIIKAPKERGTGKIHYIVEAAVRVASFEYVDQNSARYFPA